MLLTRPTYQGLLSSTELLRQTAALCHAHGVPLIIDEAHGSHLRFLSDDSMLDGMSCGADITIQSTHKTLTSLSQTAMMHLSPGKKTSLSSHFSPLPTVDGFRFLINNYTDADVDMVGQQEVVDVLQSTYSALTTTSPNCKL